MNLVLSSSRQRSLSQREKQVLRTSGVSSDASVEAMKTPALLSALHDDAAPAGFQGTERIQKHYETLKQSELKNTRNNQPQESRNNLRELKTAHTVPIRCLFGHAPNPGTFTRDVPQPPHLSSDNVPAKCPANRRQDGYFPGNSRLRNPLVLQRAMNHKSGAGPV